MRFPAAAESNGRPRPWLHRMADLQGFLVRPKFCSSSWDDAAVAQDCRGRRYGYRSFMNAGEATIEQLARDVIQITDPDTALRALTALRQELDATEPELVLRALQDGASWSQVARALGITKQAAHRKYRFLFEHAITVPASTKLQVTGEARRTIQYAREEAKRVSQPAVGTEHILLGILRCDRSAGAKALNAVGVTLERARASLQTTLPGLTSEQLESAGTDGISQQARLILERAVREAVQRGDGHIGVEHLLLGFLV